MYRKFIETEDYLPVPKSGFTLKVSRDGNLIDENSQPVSTWTDTQDDTYARVFGYRGYDDYRIEELILLAFKPLLLPEYHWSRLTVDYLTEDRTLDVSNLGWVFPPKLEVKELPEFFYVPGHSRYATNESGVIVNLENGELVNYYVKSQYHRCSLKNDLDKWYLSGVHRFVCSAVHGCPINEAELDVNHDNFVRDDNRSVNIEWTTKKENSEHRTMYGTPPPADRVREYKVYTVWVRYPKTGEVISYPSLNRAARGMDLSVITVRTMGTKVEQPLYDKRYQLVISDEEPIWRDVDDHEYEQLYVVGIHLPIDVRWASTGDVQQFPSAMECGYALNIHKDTVLHRIKDHGQSIWNDGTQLKASSDKTPWGSTDDWLRRRKSTKRSKRVELRNAETGEVTSFENVRQLADYINVNESSISIWSRKKGFPVFPVPNGYPKGIQLRLYDNTDDWRIPENPIAELNEYGYTRTILRRDVNTGVVDRFDSMVECANACNVGKTTIAFRLKSNGQNTYQNRWQYQYYTEDPSWG